MEQMERARAAIIRMQMTRTISNLQANRIEAEIVETPAQLLERLKHMVPDGARTASGGSVTLEETGVMDWLRSGATDFVEVDSHAADAAASSRQAQFCQFFFMSSNAITMNGELYNVDGNGNRVSALIYGPDHVVIVAGSNKIVRDLEAAEARVKQIAAPMNSARLNRNTGCTKTGLCVNCKLPERICCHTVISAYQRHPGRIHVFLLPGSYGF